VPGVTYGGSPEPEMASVPPVPPVPPEPAAAPVPDSAGPPPQIEGPLPEPVEIYYPAPVYTGIVVVNPPEGQPRRRPRDSGSPAPSANGPRTSPSGGPPERPQPTHVPVIEQHPAPPVHHPDPPVRLPDPPVHHADPPVKPAEPSRPASEPAKTNSDSSSSDKSGKH
jgi:hypothetical protein